MPLQLKKESALNLSLEGSTGTFSVGTGKEGQKSLEVKYFLTHVSLDFSTGSNEALLSHLAPVREIFDLEQLDFDEIMQRDIDDSRVSSELIPYLLDNKSRDLVKLFPPIVVIVLPVREGENLPASLYPSVISETDEESNGNPGEYRLRSGSIGQEVFQFEQPVSDGKCLKHDLVRFRLNTHKTKLVIVDGQHRAMALLALYRNLKDQWSDERRAPFKDYYAEWTPNFIQKFNLKEIDLPIILCTFPTLDENYGGDFNLKKAARSIFLTLNKSARPVSDSRNILLDDNDIIAYFLRSCLSIVKDKDLRSPYSFRIFNVELDQAKNRTKIQSPIALTGVSHLYYMIEHLLLNKGNEDVRGLRPRSGRFDLRTDLEQNNCLIRLNGWNLLGSELANSTRRDNFSERAANLLRDSFHEKYGKLIISVFERFSPYEAHNKAVLNLEAEIESYQDRQLRPILFEGQGLYRVFEQHRENLAQKRQDFPEVDSILQKLKGTADRLQSNLEDFEKNRAELFLKSVLDKSNLRVEGSSYPFHLIKWISKDLYENILTTVAFQTGLVCSFFAMLEKANLRKDKTDQEVLEFETCFNEYLNQVNSFFIPATAAQFKTLVKVFSGDFAGAVHEWNLVETNYTFRNVVHRGEMQPDQWPKYKYLILEIWKPSDPILAQVLTEEVDTCREQAFSALYSSNKTTYCRENSKLEENLDKSERVEIFDSTFNTYYSLLKNLGSNTLERAKMEQAVSFVAVSDVNGLDS